MCDIENYGSDEPSETEVLLFAAAAFTFFIWWTASFALTGITCEAHGITGLWENVMCLGVTVIEIGAMVLWCFRLAN